MKINGLTQIQPGSIPASALQAGVIPANSSTNNAQATELKAYSFNFSVEDGQVSTTSDVKPVLTMVFLNGVLAPSAWYTLTNNDTPNSPWYVVLNYENIPPETSASDTFTVIALTEQPKTVA